MMDKSAQKIKDVLGYLSDQLVRGWVALQVSKHLYQALQNQKITCARYFFTSAYLSCTESAVLTLSRLIIPNNDSINIAYLLNVSKQNPKAFSYTGKEEVLKAVLEYEQKIETIASLVVSIKDHRDRTIAHLDRKYINDPTVIFANPPIDMREVERVFHLVLQIINTYKGYFDSSELYLAHLEKEVEDDLGYLTHLIKEADERD